MRGDPITLVLASPREVDRLALATLIEHWPACCLLAAESTLEAAAVQCRRFLPHAALFDLGFSGEVYSLATRLVREGVLRAIGLLDVDFAFFRAKRTLAIPKAAYFTRHEPFGTICDELRALVSGEQRPRMDRCSDLRTIFPALTELEARTLGQLTVREEELFVLLAQGMSVKQAAVKMRLAESTVDNHKWRLMKKLNVQRTTHLTRLALRAGLIE